MKTIEELEAQIAEINKELEELKNHKKGRWRGKEKENYYHLDSSGIVCIVRDLYYNTDTYRYKTGNYFQTKEEAENWKGYEWMKVNQKLKDIANELNGDWDYKIGEDYQIITENLTGVFLDNWIDYIQMGIKFSPYVKVKQILERITKEEIMFYLNGY